MEQKTVARCDKCLLKKIYIIYIYQKVKIINGK